MYKRDKQKVLSFLEVKNNQLITKKACKIVIPKRWIDVGLADIGLKTFSYGFFPIIDEETGHYLVCSVPVKIELSPYLTATAKYEDEEYLEFKFKANQVVFKTMEVIKKKTFVFYILDELIFKGKVPWYASYSDMTVLFRLAKKYAGSDVAKVDAVAELVASIISRDPKNHKAYIRNSIPNQKEYEVKDVQYVALSSVVSSVNNTVNKLVGAYFADGVQSALVHPSKKTERLETVLRS